MVKSKSLTYPHLERKYEKIKSKHSSKPFSITTGEGKIWYYLSCTLDKQYMKDKMALLHNCRTCASRVEHLGSFFGPDGFAIPMGGTSGGENDVFIDMENERERNKHSLDSLETFFITNKSLKRFPSIQGTDPDGKSYGHVTIKLDESKITTGILGRKIDNKYTQFSRTADPDHFDSETRLEIMITSLQESEDGKSSFMDTMKNANMSRDLKRKPFWEGHIEYISTVQKFSSKFKNGTKWNQMDDISKAHVRIFARFYGGNHQSVLNTRFKGAGQIIDCFKDVGSERETSSLVSFMNSRSDPSTYMVQQISQAVEKHAIKSRYKVSLAWSTTDDLDLWVHTDKGENIGFSNKQSRDCETRLDFDANAGSASTSPVENITLSDKKPGSYVVYVNNYTFRAMRDIPFMVIVSVDGYDQTFTGTWSRSKHANTQSSLGSMLKITTVRITSEMIASNIEFEMSEKLSKKFDGIKKDFVSQFGMIRSEVIDMHEISDSIIPTKKKTPSAMDFLSSMKKTDSIKINTKPRTSAEIARDSQIGNMRKTKIGNFIDILSGFKSMEFDVRIHLRDFPPAYMTTPIGCEDKIKYPFVVNTYYEEGRAPRRPDPDAKDVCRINNKWMKSHYAMDSVKVSGMVKIDRPGFSGYFISVENMKLPESCERDWVIGGGMYPTDLKSEYHLYRDIWHAHHAITSPVSNFCIKKPAIGIFVHVGKMYNFQIDGRPMNVKI